MRTSFIVYLLLLLSFLPAQSQRTPANADLREFLTQQTWTNGYEFVRYVPSDVPEVMGIPNPSALDSSLIFMIGGSLHEGGTHLCLEEREHTFVVTRRHSSDYQWFPIGSEVKIKVPYLLVRNPGNGCLEGVLQPLKAEETLEDLMKKQMLQYILAGKYVDAEGHLYTFSDTECRVWGFTPSPTSFNFGYLFDTPTCVLEFKEKSYRVRQEGRDLRLLPVKKQEYCYQAIENEPSLSLHRLQDSLTCDYPILSQKILIDSEILLYAGYSSFSSTPEQRQRDFLRLIHTLGTMRNEIYARHGYEFQSEPWKSYFMHKAWYHPKSKDVETELSDIEHINIEHLRTLEIKFRSGDQHF